MTGKELGLELKNLGIVISNSGLGPTYMYDGIVVASGIDAPTTIERHWTIHKHGMFGMRWNKQRAAIISYRKKYATHFDVVDGRPVKKYVREVYKEYDEYRNQKEFLHDLAEAVASLKEQLPNLDRRAKLLFDDRLRRLPDNKLISMDPRHVFSWKSTGEGPRSRVVLDNGTVCNVYCVGRDLMYIATLNADSQLRDAYICRPGEHAPCIEHALCGDSAARFIDSLSDMVKEQLLNPNPKIF